jgi:hypothetical protein
MLLKWFNIYCHETPASYDNKTDFPTPLEFPDLKLLGVISMKASGAEYKPRQSSYIICCRHPLLSRSSSVPSVYTLAILWDTKFHTYTKQQAQLHEGLSKSSRTHPRDRKRPETQLSVTRCRRSTAILLSQSSEFCSHRTFFLDGHL